MLIQRAEYEHAAGIEKVCTIAYRATYKDTHSREYIERTIKDFYQLERIRDEIIVESDGWDGWFVALEAGEVVGAIGGGMIGKDISEIFVLYLDPERRGEGIGTMLLHALTSVQKEKGATKQWVSVAKDNEKGIPFYEARGFIFAEEKQSYGNGPDEEYGSLRYYREI
jgi:ribosomal protein S18 acetylase RimI-like enzyme